MLYPLLAILIGYLLGSVSPAYFLGKIIKGIDIRNYNLKNAGTTNVYRTIGFWPAVITAVYDLLKGLLAMYFAYLLGVAEPIIYLSGIAAVVGHIFPFYLGFHGGQGAATCTGLLFYCLTILLRQGSLPWESIGILAILVMAILVITHEKGYLPFVVLPPLAFMVFKNYQINYLTIFVGVIITYLFCLNIYIAARDRLFVLKPETKEAILPWRTIMRPLAVVFPITYFYFDKKIILWIIGALGGIFLIMDLVRLMSSKVNLFFFGQAKYIFKKREEKRFSSITLFILSSFVTILLFPKYIAIVSLCFLIFGDVFAKFFGLQFGKIKLWNKSLEGSIAHFMACLIAGYLLWPYVELSAITIISGAIVATLAELLPVGINDNFIVPVASATAMLLINGFLV